jgi:regulator of protease activity HflC (stomatin/prohibitin superfamily)
MASAPNDPQFDPQAPDVMVDPAQESLQSALRTGFGLLMLLMLLLLVGYFSTSIFTVDAKSDQRGLLARFGKLVTAPDQSYVYEPGWYAAMPEPIDEKILISANVQTLKIDRFCFERSGSDLQKELSEVKSFKPSLQPGTDGAMLTGDRSLAHGIWTVQYRVTDPYAYVTSIGDDPRQFDPILERVVSRAIMRTVATKRVETVLYQDQTGVILEVQQKAQAALDRLGVGVQIEKVTADLVEPSTVRAAYNAVTEAQSELESQIREAEANARETLTKTAGDNYAEILAAITEYGVEQESGSGPEVLAGLNRRIDALLDQAGGEVAVALRQARGEAGAIREQIGREYEEFINYLDQYHQQPEVTVTRLWTAMLMDVFSKKRNEIFFVPSGHEVEIVVNRDPIKQLEIERDIATTTMQQR